MTDVATLGIRVESQDVPVATQRLEGLATGAAKTERATDALAGSSARAGGAVAQMIASIERGVRDLVAMGQAQMLLAQHAQESATATNALAAATDRLQAEAGSAGGAVKQLDAHMDAYRESLRATAAAAEAANDNIGKMPAAHGRATASSKAMTQATLGLSRQFADIGVTAAMGMNPLMILIQQGPQIADSFQMAASQGLSLMDVLKGMAVQFGLLRVVTTGAEVATEGLAAVTEQVSSTLGDAKDAAEGVAAANELIAKTATAAGAAETYALGPVLLILGPIVAALALAAGAFALFHRELSKEYPKNITDGLNLTDEQLKRVKTTSVGFGDTLMATFTVVGRHIMDGPVGTGLRWLGDFFSDVLDGITAGVFNAAAGIYAAFAATYKTVVENWRSFPAVLGDLAIQTVNNHIRAFNSLPEKIVTILNMVIGFFAGAWEGIVAGANALPGLIASAFSRAFRGAIDIARSAVSAIGKAITTLSTDALDAFNGAAERAPAVGAAMAAGVQRGLSSGGLLQVGPMIAELENPFAGAGERLGATFAENFRSEFEGAKDAMRAIGSEIGDEALARARRNALKEAGDANKAAAAAGDQRAASLQRELDAMEATTEANYDLARAYEESGGAAAEAEAKAEAIGKAIRRQGDIALFVAATLALNASKEAVTGAKKLREMLDTTEAQERLNAQVAAGLMTSDQANQALSLEATLRPIIAAAATEEGDRKAYLLELIQKLTGGQQALNAATLAGQLLAENGSAQDQIALLERETQLLGATNVARAVALAQMAKEQEIRAKGGDVAVNSSAGQAAIRAAGDLAAAQVRATEAATNHNAALNEQLDTLSLIEERARSAGQGMADAFGPVGRALGDLTSMIAGYATAQEEAARRTADAIKAAGDDQVAINRIQQQSAEEASQAQINHYGDMIGAAKGFFAEQTAAYKLLQAAEQTYRLFQFAMAVKAMVLKGAETTVTVTGAGVEAGAVAASEATKTAATLAGAAARIPAKVAEGAASMFAALGPFGFAAVAAMFAVLAALGFSGGGGSRSAPTLPSTNTGTGTVSGSPNDASASIAKSLEVAERYQNQDLEYSSEMVNSLRKIQDGIGSVTDAIARQMGVGGGFSTDGLDLGSKVVKGFFGLFSTQRTRELVDQGLELFASNLGSILSDGLSGRIYQTVQNTKTKSGFLGFGGGTTTWNETTFSGLPAELSRELTNLLGTLRDGVLTAASELGIEGAEAVLDAFQVNIGRISFEGMNAQEISDRLSAVFSAVGDQMASAIVPQLASYQKAGEGMMETLVRLATTFNAVDTTLASINMTFNATGIESLAARNRLVELLGGLEEFTDSATFFANNFLTEAQRIAPIQAAVNAELTRLGISTDINRTQFADLVMGLDVSTEAGAAMYAALMRLAPALAQVLDYQEDLTGVVEDQTEILRQRRDLEIQLMEALGQTAEATAARRADVLAGLPEELRALQEQVWAAQDAAEANRALADAQAKAAEDARQAAERMLDLQERLYAAQGNDSAALALRRQRELEAAANDNERALLALIYAAEDATAAQQALADAQAAAAQAAQEAAEAARQLAEQRAGLEIRLLRAQGRELAAVARERELELAALPEALRALQQQVWAAEDAAAANAALAEAQAAAAQAAAEAAQKAREIAQARANLEIELLQAQGRDVAALAAQRRLELEALDPSLRALQQQVWAALDAAEANKKLAQAQAEAAQRAAEIAKQRQSLEIELLRAQGRETAALALERKAELASMPASLQALQKQVWAAQDAKAAQAALAEAQQKAADAARDAAERMLDLRERLLTAQGNDAAVTALQRQRELSAATKAEQAILRQIYAAEDAAARAEAAADKQAAAMERVEAARDALTTAYERQADQLRDTIDKFGGFAESLREFRNSLVGQLDPGQTYAKTALKFQQTAALARLGNVDALGSLQDVSQKYLDAAMANAGSRLEYDRILARVIAEVDAASDVAARQKTLAEQQLDKLDKSVAGLITVNESVLTVAEAIRQLQAAMAGAGLATPAPGAPAVAPLTPVATAAAPGSAQENALAAETRALRQEVAAMRAEQTPFLKETAKQTRKTSDTLTNVTRDGESMLVEVAA